MVVIPQLYVQTFTDLGATIDVFVSNFAVFQITFFCTFISPACICFLLCVLFINVSLFTVQRAYKVKVLLRNRP